jgi:hypothetical protein
MVTVKGYVAKVVVVADGLVVATHQRSLEKHKLVLDPIHFLATLGKKPGALDHAPVFRDWKLPACFAELRVELERLHGSMSGSRRFVRVLQLLGEHPAARVSRAIEGCMREHIPSAEAVIQRTRSLAAIEAAKQDSTKTPQGTPATPCVDVPLPDLNRFNQLLFSPPGGHVSVIFA